MPAERVFVTSGLARACSSCHQKKIRCNLDSSRLVCSNCELHGTPCTPRTRKRKHDQVGLASVEPPSTRRLHAATKDPDSQPSPATAEAVESAVTSHIAPSSELAEHESPGTSPAEVPWTTAKVDFAKYFAHDIIPSDGPQVDDHGVCEVDMVALRLYKAFDLPSRTWTSSLLEEWNNYIQPLMPIVQSRWLVAREGYTVPVVLLKAVLLAGARTSEASSSFPCDEYYRALRALVYCHYEKNPIINIVAVCLMGWYNQTSTWAVAHDSSRTWLHFASNLAYQIGLHQESKHDAHAPYKRRLWWTLVARDCQVAAGTGRPRIIDLRYSTRKLISLHDFEAGDRNAPGFVAYVQIALILGDLWDSYQLGRLPDPVAVEIRNRLFWWVKELPPDLLYFTGTEGERETYGNFVARQLYTIYLGCVSLLSKTDWPTRTVSPVALIASSYMVALLEGFLARNEVPRLPAITAFYVLSAAVPQLAARQYGSLRPTVDANLYIFDETLLALSRRWPSSANVLKQYRILRETQPRTAADPPSHHSLPSTFDASELLLFETLSRDKCNLWGALTNPPRKGHEATAVMTGQVDAVPASICSNTPEMPHLGEAGGVYTPSEYNETWHTMRHVPSLHFGGRDGQTPAGRVQDELPLEIPDAMGSWLFGDDVFQQASLDYLELL